MDNEHMFRLEHWTKQAETPVKCMSNGPITTIDSHCSNNTLGVFTNSKHFETVLLYGVFSSVIRENHIEKIDYGSQTIDFMLCLFTVDLKECDHQCSCVCDVCLAFCATRVRSLNRPHSIFKYASFRFGFSIVTFRTCCVVNQWKLKICRQFVGFVSSCGWAKCYVYTHTHTNVRLRVSTVMFWMSAHECESVCW